YANELNWSVNYLFVVPAAWANAIACWERADLIAIRALGKEFWPEWKRFRRVFSHLAGGAFVIAVATSVADHLGRGPSAPAWQQASALMIPAAVLEGIHTATF